MTHQPRSNMNNAVGLPDVAGMLERGIPVALGNDGFSNNMFDEMKAAYLAHKHNQRNPQAMPGDAVWQMAYDNNAALAAASSSPSRSASCAPARSPTSSSWTTRRPRR